MTSARSNYKPLDQHAIEMYTEQKQNDFVRLLKEREDIQECIALLESTIRKRKMAIGIPAGLVFIGVLCYIIYNHFEFQEYSQQLDIAIDQTIKSLRKNLTALVNESHLIEHQYTEKQLVLDLRKQAVRNHPFWLQCVFKKSGEHIMSWRNNCESIFRSIPSENMFNPNTSCLITPKNECEGTFDPRNPSDYTIVIPDTIHEYQNCVTTIKNYCTSFFAWRPVKQKLTKVNETIQHLTTEIANSRPDYNSFYSAFFHSAVFYYLVLVGVGEFPAFAIILTSIFTQKISERLSSVFYLNEEQTNKVIAVSNNVEFKHTNYGKTITKLKSDETTLSKKLISFERRQMMCMGLFGKDTKSSLSQLNMNALRAPHLLNLVFEMSGDKEATPDKRTTLFNSSPF